MALRVTYPPSSSSRHWTPDGFRQRCQELMVSQRAGWWTGRSGGLQLVSSDDLDWLDVSVPSARIEGLRYTVRYDTRTDGARCQCVAASRGQPCWHAGVALAYGRRAVELQRGAAQIADRQQAHEDNARCLGF